ncbi:DUF2889 domain-containing protein [Cupriavidus sp. 2TAF22]|uniref:DUF2889 domain-containing protein n=1 Tax=unclassified Cupriavidus TaxID=2640874 RepID=UPI003F91B17D
MMTSTTDRTAIHTRQVTCHGYERSDGMLEIEAELRDLSPTGTDLLFKQVPPGGAIHHMRIVVTMDRALLIHDVKAVIETGPTEYCRAIESAYAGLIGLQIRGGFRQQARAIVGGVRGCTHLTELLGPLATTATQTTMAIGRRERKGRWPGEGTGPMPKPVLIGSCHTYHEDGEAAKLLWPVHRRVPAAQDA